MENSTVCQLANTRKSFWETLAKRNPAGIFKCIQLSNNLSGGQTLQIMPISICNLLRYNGLAKPENCFPNLYVICQPLATTINDGIFGQILMILKVQCNLLHLYYLLDVISK